MKMKDAALRVMHLSGNLAEPLELDISFHQDVHIASIGEQIYLANDKLLFVDQLVPCLSDLQRKLLPSDDVAHPRRVTRGRGLHSVPIYLRAAEEGLGLL